MNTLLIEIGAEEIPAGYIVPALEAFRDNLVKTLEKDRITCGKVKIYGTPRRLALLIDDLPELQRAETSTITGPPESVGFDDSGKPTLAAEKFAEKAGVPLDQVIIKETDKGRYLSAVKEESCEACAAVLERRLPDLILAIPFPKSMRWADLSISFARPIISIAALLGTAKLNFSVGDINSSNQVFGHEFMFPGKVTVPAASDYLDILKTVGVIADMGERKQLQRQKMETVAADYNAVILEDDALEDINMNLVEYPYPCVGKFDDEFLEVPDEVLITAMREHQKYFALTDENGKLKPYFIAVNNTNAKDPDLVANGHGRVIRARLADAKFFYKVDLESTMDQFADKLKNVTFQAALGTMYEKRERLVDLGGYLSGLVDSDDETGLKTDVMRAAELCKADLVSQMVIEFTKLQGVIGRVYAKKAGENDAVANAIEQHYRPVYSGGVLPDSTTGKLLAIADKIDTICGCFSEDLIPTGASDPYALRRQGIGIIQIILEGNFPISLFDLINRGVSLYVTDDQKKEATANAIHGFFKSRMENMLVEQGYSREAVKSALSVSFDVLPDDLLRIKALETLRQAPDFEPVSVAFKRVVNILKQAGAGDGEVDTSIFENDSEQALFAACQRVGGRVETHINQGEYGQALKEIALIRPDVDRFFDDVMVMVDDEAVKNNRIALLASVSDLFKNIADFSMI